MPLGAGEEQERAFLTTSLISFQVGSFMFNRQSGSLTYMNLLHLPRGSSLSGLEWTFLIKGFYILLTALKFPRLLSTQQVLCEPVGVTNEGFSVLCSIPPLCVC
ncbi:hypothetical protein DPMN_129903 [Dreissena polymorpha]|uniref:Uncharacterized protein n=1 Tax=Dreissena polymorpha TaxID=45954 RepID=A0A9D4H9Y6_DREPO|nr:hypothetical protein DPMN_129903 [Dreissena polymorpha]